MNVYDELTRQMRFQRRGLFRWFICIALVLSNGLLALPPLSVIIHFQRTVVAPKDLRVEMTNTGDLRVFDPSNALVLRGYIPELPIAALQSALESRRLRELAKHGMIAVWIKAPDFNDDKCIATIPAISVWAPNDQSQIHFTIETRNLIPEDSSEVWAVLYADPPWGNRQSGEISQAELHSLQFRTVLPGSIFLEATTTPRIQVDMGN